MQTYPFQQCLLLVFIKFMFIWVRKLKLKQTAQCFICEFYKTKNVLCNDINPRFITLLKITLIITMGNYYPI